MRNRHLGHAILRWFEGLQNGEPVAYAVLGVIVLLLALVGYAFLADRRQERAVQKKRAAGAMKMKMRAGAPPANPTDPTRPRR